MMQSATEGVPAASKRFLLDVFKRAVKEQSNRFFAVLFFAAD